MALAEILVGREGMIENYQITIKGKLKFSRIEWKLPRALLRILGIDIATELYINDIGTYRLINGKRYNEDTNAIVDVEKMPCDREHILVDSIFCHKLKECF